MILGKIVVPTIVGSMGIIERRVGRISQLQQEGLRLECALGSRSKATSPQSRSFRMTLQSLKDLQCKILIGFMVRGF